MRAGDLRRFVKIQVRGTLVDTFGQKSTVWSDVATTWADIQPLSGRELETAQAIHSEVTTQIRVRYRTNLTAANRIVYQGRNFAVLAVMDSGTQHRELMVMCAEGLTDGS